MLRTIALIFAFFCALILLTKLVGDFAMAREGNYKSRLSTVEPDPPAKGSMEEYYLTPKGREIKAITEMMDRGDREGAKEAIEAFKKKWPIDPADRPPPPKPRNDIDRSFPRVMTLPPEAR